MLKWHGKRKGSHPILRFWAQPTFCNMSHNPSLKVLWRWVMERDWLLMAEGGYPEECSLSQELRYVILHNFHPLRSVPSSLEAFLSLADEDDIWDEDLPSRGLWFHAAIMRGRLTHPFVDCPQLFWNPRLVVLPSCRPVCPPLSQPSQCVLSEGKWTSHRPF